MPDDLDTFLAPLPDARRDAVKAWLASSIGTCELCDQPVLVSDPKVLPSKANGPVHKDCAPEQE